MHNINVLEIAETWVNKSDEPEFFNLYARIGCSRQSHESLSKNSGPHWLSGYGL